MNASVQKAIQRYSSDSIGKIVMGSETSIFDGGSAIGFSYDNKEQRSYPDMENKSLLYVYRFQNKKNGANGNARKNQGGRKDKNYFYEYGTEEEAWTLLDVCQKTPEELDEIVFTFREGFFEQRGEYQDDQKWLYFKIIKTEVPSIMNSD